MTLKEFKKLYDQVQAYDRHIPGWQLLPDKVAKVLWKEKMEYYAKEVTKKNE